MLGFYVDNLLQTRVEGTLLAQPKGLKLVFHRPAEDQRLFDADVQELFIDWANLADIQFRKGLLRHRIEITVHSSDSFPKLLRPRRNQLELRVRTQDTVEFDELERTIPAYRRGAEQDPEEATDEFIDDMRDFLDRM